MTNPTDDSLKKIADKIEHMNQFSPEEERLVREVIEAYRGWVSLGRAGKILVMFLAGVTATVVGLAHVKDVVISWLTK